MAGINKFNRCLVRNVHHWNIDAHIGCEEINAIAQLAINIVLAVYYSGRHILSDFNRAYIRWFCWGRNSNNVDFIHIGNCQRQVSDE